MHLGQNSLDFMGKLVTVMPRVLFFLGNLGILHGVLGWAIAKVLYFL